MASSSAECSLDKPPCILSVGRIRQCVTSFGAHRRNTDRSLKVSISEVMALCGDRYFIFFLFLIFNSYNGMLYVCVICAVSSESDVRRPQVED